MAVLEKALDHEYTYIGHSVYHHIDGLIVIGPDELERACRSLDSDKPNPLELNHGWIPLIAVAKDMDNWIRSCVWRDHPDWRTRAALVLMPPAIDGIPTSLVGQQKLWGVAHDGIGPGIIRSDIFWTNWFIEAGHRWINPWANTPAVSQWKWMLFYEHPLWISNYCWQKQIELAFIKNAMLFSTAAQDTLMLNLVLAATGMHFRNSVFSRTATIYHDHPLLSSSRKDGVYLDTPYGSQLAKNYISASVNGVPTGWK